MCNCNCNRNSCQLIVSTAIALDGTTALNITIPDTVFNNGETFGLLLEQNIPAGASPVPVNITMGSTDYPLLKPCGNYVMSDQIRKGRIYVLRAGSNPAHFTVRCSNVLAGTSFVAPQIIPAATATGA